jgi:hypothetical protein
MCLHAGQTKKFPPVGGNFFNSTLPLTSSILMLMAATDSKVGPAQKLLPVCSKLQPFRLQPSDYCLHCYSWQIVSASCKIRTERDKKNATIRQLTKKQGKRSE